jgi:thiol-disulfide isomerase/thioredoxin
MLAAMARPIRLRFAALALAAVFATAAEAGSDAVAAGADASKPFIVKIHASWCGTCTRLEPTFEVLQERIGDEVRIVVLDVSDPEAVVRSATEADRLGIREFFDSYKTRTGTVGVLDGATREPVTVFKGELNAATYEAAVEKARADSTS